jgi:alpha-glucoside transport system permease protein
MTSIRKEAVAGASTADNIAIILGRTFRSNIVSIALFLIVALWTIPTVGLLVSSIRPEEDIASTGWWTVLSNPEFTLNNYKAVIESGDMGDAFINSLTVTIPATIIPIGIAAFAAYAFAWMEFPGRRFLLAVVIGLLVVPLQMSLIPLLRIYVTLGINNSFAGIWLAHTGFGLPLAIFLLRNYIAGLPRELIESAAIDGASHFTIFVRLVIPLSVPVLASFAIFQFLWVWNDLLVALVFLGGKPVVTSALSALVSSRGNDWHLLTAGAFVSMILPLTVFFSLQRYFVRGLLAGSIKGG